MPSLTAVGKAVETSSPTYDKAYVPGLATAWEAFFALHGEKAARYLEGMHNRAGVTRLVVVNFTFRCPGLQEV